ncbi:MAG: hypothetical protein RMJ16_15265 [Thermoguttaceae bacterium]|nr:hypothetical protein [Thermoguttaceae bacterium]
MQRQTSSADFWRECAGLFLLSGAGQLDIRVWALPQAVALRPPFRPLDNEALQRYGRSLLLPPWAKGPGAESMCYIELCGLPARGFGLSPESPWVKATYLLLSDSEIAAVAGFGPPRAAPQWDTVMTRIGEEVIFQQRHLPRDILTVEEHRRELGYRWIEPLKIWVLALARRVLLQDVPGLGICFFPQGEAAIMLATPQCFEPDAFTGDHPVIEGFVCPSLAAVCINNLAYASSELAKLYAAEFAQDEAGETITEKVDPEESAKRLLDYVLRKNFSTTLETLVSIFQSPLGLNDKLASLESCLPTIKELTSAELAQIFGCTDRAIRKTATYSGWQAEAADRKLRLTNPS